MQYCTPLGPQQHTCHAWSHWMNGSQHNKNASRQTDRPTEIPAFIREKNMFRPLPPKLRIFDVDYYRSFEAQKMVFGPALVDSRFTQLCGAPQSRVFEDHFLRVPKTLNTPLRATVYPQTHFEHHNLPLQQPLSEQWLKVMGTWTWCYWDYFIYCN